MRRIFTGLGVAASCVLASPIAAQAATVDFSGRTVTVIVAFEAGGPVDLFARLIAMHVGRHIPGNPTILVQNMPGAGGVVASNHLYTVARSDGSVFGVTIAPFTNQYIGGGKVRFDTAKFFWLGALNISQATYVNDKLGVKTLADLVKTDTQIVVGGLVPTSSRDLRMRSFLETLGITNYKYVSGYRGTLPVRRALLQNEVNMSDESVVAIAVDMASDVQAGRVIPLVQTGLTRPGKRMPDPQVPAIPITQDAIVAVKGEVIRNTVEFRAMVLVESMVALGRAVFAPPGIDRDAGETLRAAVDRLDGDPKFQVDARRIAGGTDMELIKGADAQRFAEEVTEMIRADPEAVAYLDGLVAKKTGP